MRGRGVLFGIACMVLLGSGAGLAVLYRADASPVVRTIALDTNPWAAALDEQSGRLYVVNRSFGFGLRGRLVPIGGNLARGSTLLGSNGGGFTNSGGGFSNSGAGGFTTNGAGGGTVSVIDVRGGAVLGTLGVGDDPRAVTIDARHGLAYVSNDDDASVSVLDTRNGAYVRATQVGARPHALAVDGPDNRIFTVNTSDGTVSMLDARRGRVLRTVQAPGAVESSGAIVDSRLHRVYIVGGGSISVLDARSGALLHTGDLPGQPSSSFPADLTQMAVDEAAGRVYVLQAGVVSVLEAASGRLLRRLPVNPNATALALDTRRGRLLIASSGAVDDAGTVSGSGSISVVDPLSGATLRTMAVGLVPSTMLTDTRDDRLVVVDSGGTQRVVDPLGWLPGGLRSRLPFASGGGTRTVPGRVIVLDLSRL